MKRSIYLVFLFSTLILAGCASLRSLPGEAESAAEAEASYVSGAYEQALEQYKGLIEQKRNREEEIPDKYYRQAGLAADALGRTELVLDYLEPLRHDSLAGARVFAALARAYEEVDNLSREITSLETYVNHYPEGEELRSMRLRYFETLTESQNWDRADRLWTKIEADASDNEALLNRYLYVKLALGQEQEANRLASELLELNPDNTDALERMGKLHYHRAEEIHQRETRAYEQNRTQRQYAQLLEAYEAMNEDLRKALRYFLRLYELDADRETASFLRNIYTRFNDEERARYYERLMRE